jgi:hypothetical protein
MLNIVLTASQFPMSSADSFYVVCMNAFLCRFILCSVEMNPCPDRETHGLYRLSTQSNSVTKCNPLISGSASCKRTIARSTPHRPNQTIEVYHRAIDHNQLPLIENHCQDPMQSTWGRLLESQTCNLPSPLPCANHPFDMQSLSLAGLYRLTRYNRN